MNFTKYVTGDCCKQKTFWDKLSGTKYMVTGEYSDCGPDWCPTFPFYSKHELNVVSSPKTAAEFIVVKVMTNEHELIFVRFFGQMLIVNSLNRSL